MKNGLIRNITISPKVNEATQKQGFSWLNLLGMKPISAKEEGASWIAELLRFIPEFLKEELFEVNFDGHDQAT
jgi:hypothetical protein